MTCFADPMHYFLTFMIELQNEHCFPPFHTWGSCGLERLCHLPETGSQYIRSLCSHSDPPNSGDQILSAPLCCLCVWTWRTIPHTYNGVWRKETYVLFLRKDRWYSFMRIISPPLAYFLISLLSANRFIKKTALFGFVAWVGWWGWDSGSRWRPAIVSLPTQWLALL